MKKIYLIYLYILLLLGCNTTGLKDSSNDNNKKNSDDISWVIYPPAYIKGTNTYSIKVDYNALDSRDLVITLEHFGDWIKNKEMKQTIDAGSGSLNFSFTPDSNPSPGTYQWKAEIRPVDGIWSDSFKSLYRKVTIDDPATVPPGTLLDESDDIMRGIPMIIGKNSYISGNVAFTENINSWNYVKTLGFNSVRLCWIGPWYKKNGYDYWTIAEVVSHIDIAVNHAETSGMNLIINYHGVGDQENDFDLLNEFWTVVAPRYKDKTFVYYEITNEPTFSYSTWKTASFENGIKAAYNIIDTLAPDRHILLFSFNSIAYDIKSIVDQYSLWIDWDKTTVAFHMYNGDDTFYIENLINNYRHICTEWNYYGEFDYIKKYYNHDINAQTLEQFETGWFDWRDWDDSTLNETADILIPDAHTKGYWWGD